jgi:hypothetical protein
MSSRVPCPVRRTSRKAARIRPVEMSETT